ncbi:MAG TPA: pyridoxamine 5'-phosphate oxidase family protein [Candidatus Micrarchaeia archaeon]|nr:pyridoxamine 5'-phosphate oxidase family protein [Candidatus Micrarchaeia archaeon]
MTRQVGPAPASPRVRVRRHPDRGRYDWDAAAAILDEALVVHLAVAVGDGPTVLPTLAVRRGRTVYVHGARANALLGAALRAPVCLCATVVDGLVLARSGFHHSANYRSVVLFGRAIEVLDPAEKAEVLDRLIDRMSPGRAAELRRPLPTELRATRVLAIVVEAFSAKVRTGGPVDLGADRDEAVWAGEVPLRMVAGAPRPDPACRGDPPAPTLPQHLIAPPEGPNAAPLRLRGAGRPAPSPAPEG